MKNIPSCHVFPFPPWGTVLLLAVSALCLLMAEAAVANRGNPQFAEGMALHDAARKGKDGAAGKAIAIFKEIIAKTPENSLARAYLGSSYALKGRNSESVANKVRYTNRGLRYLDQAVKAAPEDFIVRLIRASVASNLPAMFGRRKTAIADMLALDKLFQAAPNPRNAQEMVKIYEALGEYAPEKGDWKTLGGKARTLAGKK